MTAHEHPESPRLEPHTYGHALPGRQWMDAIIWMLLYGVPKGKEDVMLRNST